MNFCGPLCSLCCYLCCGTRQRNIPPAFESKFNDIYIDQQIENESAADASSRSSLPVEEITMSTFDAAWKENVSSLTQSTDIIVRSVLGADVTDKVIVRDHGFASPNETVAVPAIAMLQRFSDRYTGSEMTDNSRAFFSPNARDAIIMSPVHSPLCSVYANWEKETANQSMGLQCRAGLEGRTSPRRQKLGQSMRSPVSTMSSSRLFMSTSPSVRFLTDADTAVHEPETVRSSFPLSPQSKSIRGTDDNFDDRSYYKSPKSRLHQNR
jgi:hypothetical protein